MFIRVKTMISAFHMSEEILGVQDDITHQTFIW